MLYYYCIKFFLIVYWFNGEKNVLSFLYNIVNWFLYKILDYTQFFVFTLTIEAPDCKGTDCISKKLNEKNI